MRGNNPMRETLRATLLSRAGVAVKPAAAAAAAEATLDSAASTGTGAAAAATGVEVVVDAAAAAVATASADAAVILDDAGAMGDGADYATTDIALKAGAALQEWAETLPSDLDDGETLATRLSALMVGIADADFDGEISDAESTVLDVALNAAWDYLSGKGVSEDDISMVLNDWDDEAANRVQELLASSLPDGDEAAARELDDFVFGDGADEAALDAVYKKKLVIRDGKKTRINKRISGTIRLSAKQKVGVKKMLRKSHSAVAQMRRMKSMRVRSRSIAQ